MVPTSKSQRPNWQEPIQNIAAGLIESIGDVHESFEDMLNNFGKLHIESPPIDEHPPSLIHSSDWISSHKSCMTCCVEGDGASWREVDGDIRKGELSTGQTIDRESDFAAFEEPVELEGDYTRVLPLTEVCPGLEDSVIPLNQADTTLSPCEVVSRVESCFQESGNIYPEVSLHDVDDLLQCHEPMLDLQVWEHGLPMEQAAFVPKPCREQIIKSDGSKFVVTGMHHLTACKPIDTWQTVNLSFGSFDIKTLKSMLLEKYENKVPLDRITFTSADQYSILSESRASLPSHRKGLKSSQWHGGTKMTPEDWHHVLQVCGDEDWLELDRLWHNSVPTVTSDFICSICDADLPKPQHKRVWELRGGS